MIGIFLMRKFKLLFLYCLQKTLRTVVVCCLPWLLFCFTVSSSSRFLWLIILWYAMTRTPIPFKRQTNKVPGGSSRDQGCWFLSAWLRYILRTPTVLFTASLYIRLCLPAKKKLGHDSEKWKCDFSLSSCRDIERRPDKLSWKAGGGRATRENADLDYI